MNSPAISVSQAHEYPNPLARAEALEAEITDLCAQINAASYRLLQLVAELDDEAPLGRLGIRPHIPPISYCGRRKAHCGTPYSRRPAKRSVNYAGADLWSVRRATASLRRPRDVNRWDMRANLLRALAQLALRYRHERGAGKGSRRTCVQTVTIDLCIVFHG